MKAQDLKNSILQLAIQGKLVEQKEEEGTAKELIEKIKAEKEKLIKEKKIKKEKPLPEITEDEIPFDIPESWEWKRLSDICLLTDGVKVNNVSLPYLEARYLRGKIDPQIKKSGKFINRGEYLILVDGENSGEIFISDEDGIMGSTFKVLSINNAMYDKYILNLLRFYQSLFKGSKRGAAIPHLDKTLFKNLVIGIPPLAEQKRIVEKIEELMPYVEQYDKAYTEVEELNKKFPEDMQKSILQYAIQGKLVEQLEEEGTAEELYQKIQAEKEKLIKEGKIKKTKPLPEITEEEIPFDIPENWKWVRLGELVSFYGGYAYKSSTYVDESNNIIIRLGNVKNDKLLLDVNPVFVPKEIADTTIKYKILTNDILFTMTGTRKKRDYFYTTLVGDEDLKQFNLFLNQRVGCLRNDCKIINIRWLSLVLKSETILSQIFSFETGTANQGNIGSDNTMGLMISLPPLSEQKRIVEKIEELLPYTKQLVKKLD